MLDPGKPSLPGLWSGASLPLPDVQGYFGGDRTIVVGEGGLDQVTVPRCDPAIVRDAVARAVEEGAVWLVNGPTSLWKEPAPAAALDGNAVLRPRPEPVTPSGLLPESLPAWAEGATNGARLDPLSQALSHARGETMSWGLRASWGR